MVVDKAIMRARVSSLSKNEVLGVALCQISWGS